MLAILSISISFSVLSLNLNESDIAKIKASNWKIYFDDISEAYLEGSATEDERPILENESTSIKNLHVTFNEYNDSVSYILSVVNDGAFDARIASISYFKPICYGSGNTAQIDAEMVCDNILFELSYASGSKIGVNDVLEAKDRQNLKLTVKYTGKEIPTNTVEVQNLSMAIIYAQK